MSELTCRNCHHYERTQEGPTAWKHVCLAGFEVFSCKESDMSERIIGALRRIRRCESEAAAQEVLEGLIAEVVAKERKACWDEINGAIKIGQLPGDGFDETAQRNGLVLASNIIMARIELSSGNPQRDISTEIKNAS